MKRITLFALLVFLTASLATLSAQTPSTVAPKGKATLTQKAAVEVRYFHFTRRCLTCNAVEEETLKALKTLYPKQFKAGKITFKSLNLDEKDGQSCAGVCGAEGQSLLIMKQGKKWDLTRQGFMYARTNPEKLHAEIKKTIDPLLK